MFGIIQTFREGVFLFANKYPHFCENAIPEQEASARGRVFVYAEAGRGAARQGTARLGRAGRGAARQGLARQGEVKNGLFSATDGF